MKDNIGRVTNVIDLVQKEKIPRIFLFLDPEKAFD